MYSTVSCRGSNSFALGLSWLSFDNIAMEKRQTWVSNLRPQTNKWQEHPLYEVTQIIGEAHESLGATVTDDPV